MSDGSDTIEGADEAVLSSRGPRSSDEAILAQLAEALLKMPPARNPNAPPESNETEHEWSIWQGPARRQPDLADNVRLIEPRTSGRFALLRLSVIVAVLVGMVVVGVWLLVASDPGVF